MTQSARHPLYRRISRCLQRSRDRKEIGTLEIIRTHSWKLYGEDGQRLATPRLEDVLVVTITGPTGEQVTWLEIPTRELVAEVGAET